MRRGPQGCHQAFRRAVAIDETRLARSTGLAGGAGHASRSDVEAAGTLHHGVFRS